MEHAPSCTTGQVLLLVHEKPSVCLSAIFLAALITLPSRHVSTPGLARNESHIFWHQQVCFKKFLTAAVRRPRRLERRSVVLYVNETSIEVLKLQSAAVMWLGFETRHFLF